MTVGKLMKCKKTKKKNKEKSKKNLSVIINNTCQNIIINNVSSEKFEYFYYSYLPWTLTWELRCTAIEIK